MKLMIDIDNNDYEFIKDLRSLIIGGRGNCKTIQYNVINAIKHGTPVSNEGDLISRSELKKAIKEFEDVRGYSILLYIIDNAPTVEYTFEEAFQKTVCEQKLYCPTVCGNNPKWCENCVSKGKCASTRPQADCENCDFRKFSEKFVDAFVDLMNKNDITSVEQLSEILKGGAE